MKRSHSRVISLIQQAIQACGEDFALAETRSGLRKALNAATNTAEKRVKKQTQADMFAEQAKKKNAEWWKMMLEAAKKSAENVLESDKLDSGSN